MTTRLVCNNSKHTKHKRPVLHRPFSCRSSSIGRASAFQAEGCEFDSRLRLQHRRFLSRGPDCGIQIKRPFTGCKRQGLSAEEINWLHEMFESHPRVKTFKARFDSISHIQMFLPLNRVGARLPAPLWYGICGNRWHGTIPWDKCQRQETFLQMVYTAYLTLRPYISDGK